MLPEFSAQVAAGVAAGLAGISAEVVVAAGSAYKDQCLHLVDASRGFLQKFRIAKEVHNSNHGDYKTTNAVSQVRAWSLSLARRLWIGLIDQFCGVHSHRIVIVSQPLQKLLLFLPG